MKTIEITQCHDSYTGNTINRLYIKDYDIRGVDAIFKATVLNETDTMYRISYKNMWNEEIIDLVCK